MLFEVFQKIAVKRCYKRFIGTACSTYIAELFIIFSVKTNFNLEYFQADKRKSLLQGAHAACDALALAK